jgi:hypothetical protein
MKLGTKSLLFGYHCFFLHWLFVARGWWHLHGFHRVEIGQRTELRRGLAGAIVRRTHPVYASLFDPRLWIAFVIHDWGYWGKPNMDGPEGETHPEWAAVMMTKWFGEAWGKFSLYHSRFYAKRDAAQPSKLCFADKLAICYMPTWLFAKTVTWTGEVNEYMKNSTRMLEAEIPHTDVLQWVADCKVYARKWVNEFKNGSPDTWTQDSGQRTPVTESGVWQ